MRIKGDMTIRGAKKRAWHIENTKCHQHCWISVFCCSIQVTHTANTNHFSIRNASPQFSLLGRANAQE